MSSTLNEVSAFDEAEIDRAIAIGTGPKLEVEDERTLSQDIDAHMEHQPMEIAVKDARGATLTYEEMAVKVHTISSELINSGAKHGSRIAAFCEASCDVVCSLLAAMRVGAVYVPVDVGNSDERINAILSQAKADTIIYHRATAERLSRLNVTDATLLDISALRQSNTNVADKSRASDPAILMFTSGTTGTPKGIILTHRSIRTHIIGAVNRMVLTKEVVLQQSALGFDASLCQTFCALYGGGTLIVTNNKGDPADLTALMLKEKVTMTLCVSSEYSVMLQYGGESLRKCTSWRVGMCGGEPFAPSLLGKFRQLALPELELYNAYGPAEISVASSIGLVEHRAGTLSDTSRIPIPPSIPNYAVYILDEASRPVPLGWPGEICIAGPGVAAGYLDNPSLTAIKFVPDNVTKSPKPKHWTTVYHSGDRGRMASDGQVHFLGRIDGDNQVKIRGIRIELEEVSGGILRSAAGALADVAVVVKGDTNPLLVAYVVFTTGKTPADPAVFLRMLLLSLPLPLYMRPVIAIPLDHLPINQSGKLDMKTLRERALPRLAEEPDDSDLTEMEKKLKSIWSSILPGAAEAGLQIRKDSDFFSVGGNSLLLLRLQVELRKVLYQEVSIPELFRYNTLEGLALRLGGKLSGFQAIVISWNTETCLPPEIKAGGFTVARKKSSTRSISVLLTGSTGFLGRHILDKLVSLDIVSRVHVVAVRPTLDGGARQATVPSQKVIVHTGDLSAPLQGMSPTEAEQVFDDIDVVIHNGADVSFMKSYASLRATNVTSTKTLAGLAATRGIPFHFISTAGVAHLTGQDSLAEVSVGGFEPPTDGSDGYVASKWASERLLERFNHSAGLPVWIHRPSSIIGPDAPHLDITRNVLGFSRQMRAVPDLSNWTGYFDLVGVDAVARQVAGAAVGSCFEDAGPPQGPLYVHHAGETVVGTGRLREYLEGEAGVGFEALGMGEWVERATELGLHSLVGDYLCAVQRSGVEISMPRLLLDGSDEFVDCDGV